MISKKHSWSLKRKEHSEAAWFVNALVPGAVVEDEFAPFNLSQVNRSICRHIYVCAHLYIYIYFTVCVSEIFLKSTIFEN